MNVSENTSKENLTKRIGIFFKRNPALLFLLLGYVIVLFSINFLSLILIPELICNVLGIVSMVLAIQHMKSSEGENHTADIICLIFGNPLSQIIIFGILDCFLLVGALQALGRMG